MKKSLNASLISDRVMMAKIKGQPFNINIIQAYAPTSVHSDDETEVFYEEIKQAMSYVKCGEVVIAMGEFNAKVGCGEHLDISGQFCLGIRNERGSRPLQFCEENNMMIANIYFQHPKRRLCTWRSPGDIYRNQIDFILINKRFRNAVKQARTYPGADVGSDHNPLMIKMNMYAVEIQNQYEALSKEETDQGSDLEVVDRAWQLLKTSMVQATKKVLSKKKKSKTKILDDQRNSSKNVREEETQRNRKV